MARKKEPDQLDKDSSAAIAANMSYGKYKALQYEAGYRPEPRKKPEGPAPNCQCKQCGVMFYNPYKHKRVFCSDQCHHDYYNKRSRDKRKAMQQNVS